jgi:hypothetical protein
MAATVADCPHCEGEKIGFSFLTERQLLPVERGFLTALLCNKCQGGIIRVYRRPPSSIHHGHHSPLSCPADPENFGFVVHSEYPKALPARAPEHVPDQLTRFFLQAFDNHRRGPSFI